VGTVYFEVLSQHFLEGTEENYNNFRYKNWSQHLQNAKEEC